MYTPAEPPRPRRCGTKTTYLARRRPRHSGLVPWEPLAAVVVQDRGERTAAVWPVDEPTQLALPTLRNDTSVALFATGAGGPAGAGVAPAARGVALTAAAVDPAGTASAEAGLVLQRSPCERDTCGEALCPWEEAMRVRATRWGCQFHASTGTGCLALWMTAAPRPLDPQPRNSGAAVRPKERSPTRGHRATQR